MESIQLFLPVTVKVIMTAAFRSQMIAEVEQSLAQIEANLQQLEGIRERLPDNVESQSEIGRVVGEKARLSQAKEELQWRIREAQSLRDGAEVFYQNATSCVDIKVGDDYVAATQREILIQDGKVVAIRSASSVQA